MADRPLRPATHRSLGRPLPHQQANGPRAHPVAEAEASFPPRGTSGISPGFPGLSLSTGQMTHVLLTRSRLCPGPKPGSSLHLHVLSTPPAFVLSQDQTLRERPAKPGSDAGTAVGRTRRRNRLTKSCHGRSATPRTPGAATMTGQLMPAGRCVMAGQVGPAALRSPKGPWCAHAVEFSKTAAPPRRGTPSAGAPGALKAPRSGQSSIARGRADSASPAPAAGAECSGRRC